VLVNRGWVPPDWKKQWQEGVQQQQPGGRVVVTGVAQGSEDPSSFVPRNEPDKGNYYWVDVPGIVSFLRGGAGVAVGCGLGIEGAGAGRQPHEG